MQCEIEKKVVETDRDFEWSSSELKGIVEE
jgi:hypothetical protein